MGAQCPNCYAFTFHKSPNGRVCSKCGYHMIVPKSFNRPHGTICANCDCDGVVDGKCVVCGATYK